jgi:Kef-type K+ transport system membrane component KefB
MSMWLVQLAIIIVVCGCAGWLAERLGQCRVVGEIAAGILLGPSVIGAISPAFYTAMFGVASSTGIAQLGDIGVILLMFQLGLHLNLDLEDGIGSLSAPLIVAFSGMAFPFAAGAAVAALSWQTLAPHIPATRYVLFCGVALSVSAVPSWHVWCWIWA